MQSAWAMATMAAPSSDTVPMEQPYLPPCTEDVFANVATHVSSTQQIMTEQDSYSNKRRKLRGTRTSKDRHKKTPTPTPTNADARRVMGTSDRLPKVVVRATETVHNPMDAAPALPIDAVPAMIEAETHPSNVENDHTPATKDTKYMRNRRSKEEKWFSLRPLIIRAIIEEKSPDRYDCCECDTGVQLDNIIVCHNCGPAAYFCKKCCVKQHKHIALHQPKQWKHGTWVEYKLPVTTWRRSGHECTAEQDCLKYTEVFTLLDNQGYSHIQPIEFCACEDVAVSLVRYGFWAATPTTPTIAISLDLLTHLRSLIFNGKISLTSFISSLQHRHEAQYKQQPVKCQMSNVFTWDTVLHFMAVYHDVTHLESIIPTMTPTETCPACPEKGKIISMDGNFSLVRRHRNGKGQGFRNRHPARFFLPQKEVDSFVADYDDNSTEQRDCNNFEAGNVVRSTKQNKKLAEKGVFGSVCGHGYSHKFCNLNHGERMAYPVYLFNHIKNETGILLYDIACKMETHLKKRGIDKPEHMKFLIPIFHCYGHQLSCQMTYSPRRMIGAGLCDGEGTERLWAYLGCFSKISKEMTRENRHDLLTELLLHHSMKLTNKMATSFHAKGNKAWKTLQETARDLEEIIAVFSGTISRDTIHEWNQTEVQSIQTPQVKPTLTWKGTYALLLHQYYILRDAVSQTENDGQELKLERLGKKISKIETKEKIERWTRNGQMHSTELEQACAQKAKCLLEAVRSDAKQYRHLRGLRKRYSDGNGHSLAYRISKQIFSTSKKIDAGLTKYNECAQMSNNLTEITRERANEVDDSIYNLIDDSQDEQVDGQLIPHTMKRKAVDLLNLNDRAKEELSLVNKDIIQLHSSVMKRISTIDEAITEYMGKDHLTRYELGCLSALLDALKDVGVFQDSLERLWSAVLLSEETDMSTFFKCIKATPNIRKTDSHTESQPEESDEEEEYSEAESQPEESDEEEEDKILIEDEDWIGDAGNFL